MPPRRHARRPVEAALLKVLDEAVLAIAAALPALFSRAWLLTQGVKVTTRRWQVLRAVSGCEMRRLAARLRSATAAPDLAAAAAAGSCGRWPRSVDTVDTLPPALAVEPYVSAAVSACVDAMTPAERVALEVEENHLRDTARLVSDAVEEKRRADEATRRADEEKRRADELESRLQALLRDGRAPGGGGALGSAPPP